MAEALPPCPLIGRRTEVAAIHRAVAGGELAGMVVTGAAGVGKTRLAREAVDRVRSEGCATEWVTTTAAAATIPFGPFAPLLPTTAAARSTLRVLQQAQQALVARARGRRLVLAVDDAHLLDHASAALVHQLAVTDAAFVLLTVRSGSEVPDSISALWRDGLAGRLELDTLGQDEVVELVPALLGGHVDRHTLLELWRTTRGNVLFLRELVLAGLESGALARRGEVWSWDGPVVLSTRLLDVVEARLESLTEEERSLLETVSYGEPVAVAWLEHAFSPPLLEAVERRGLLAVERTGRRAQARLAHPLHGEALRARTPALRARRIHRGLLTSLEASGARRRDDVLRLASWSLEAGDGSRPELLVAGAHRALAALDHPLGERLARAAVDAGEGLAASEVLAEALVGQGRAEEAAALLTSLTPAREEDRARLALRTAWVLGWHQGRLRDGEALLAATEPEIAAADLRDDIRAVRANLLLSSGEVRQALAVATSVVDREDASERVRVRAAMAAVPALAHLGRIQEALRLGAHWLERARRGGSAPPYASGQLLGMQALALRLAGCLPEARLLAERAYRDAVSGRRRATGMWAMALGQVALAQGHVSPAVGHLREAAALFRTSDGAHFLPGCLAALSRALALAGDVEGAEAALAEAQTSPAAAQSAFEAETALAEVWLAAARGELSAARTRALQRARQAVAAGQVVVAAVLLHDASRLGAAAEATPRLAELSPAVDGPLVTACVAHGLALARRDGDGLDGAAAAFEEIGAHLLAAEAAGSAASLHQQEGRRGRALRAAATARRLLETCPGARSPVLATLDAPGLTSREREVATLASRGLSSRLIGERLRLSVRTVENYLQNAYSKLGVSSRGELAGVLGLRPTHAAAVSDAGE